VSNYCSLEKLKHIHRPVQVSPSKFLKENNKIQAADMTNATNDLNEIIKANPAVDGKFAFRKRFDFTMKFEGMIKLNEALDKCNSRFREFVDGIDGIHRLKMKNPSKSEIAKELTSSLFQFREHADSLYAAVSRGCPLTCHPTHEAMLIRECRSALSNVGNAKTHAAICLWTGSIHRT